MKNLNNFQKLFFKKRTIALLGSLVLMSQGLFGVNSLPQPIGGPINLNPSLTFPDPILANLKLVMDNHYQPPYYPGNFNSPTYLKDIYYISDAFTAGGIMFNPFDDKIVHVSLGQNQVINDQGIFYGMTFGSNTFCTSYDQGETWSYGPPVAQIIPLGGDLSQIINASLGPGLYTEYAKDGTLHASGWGFFDMVSNPPNLDPLAGFLYTTSNDDGASWAPVAPVWVNNPINRWFRAFRGLQSIPLGNTASLLQEFFTTVDPSDPNIVHACAMQVSLSNPSGTPPGALFSNNEVLYFRSEDGGKTFSAPVLAYSIAEDPKWLTEIIDPSYGTNREYLDAGGSLVIVDHPIVVDKNTIIIPIVNYEYRKGLSDLRISSSYGIKVGAVRSADGGKTWSPCAGYTPEGCWLTLGAVDPGFIDPEVPVIIEGHPCYGVFGDGPGPSRGSSGTSVISPSTGRIYQLFRTGGQPISINAVGANIKIERTRQGIPTLIVASSSADKGATWSSYVEVSQTPKDIPVGAQQILPLGSAAISNDGWFAVVYYDFRNWTGYPGEIYDNIDPETAPPLPTDAWVAIYRETPEATGGSTGIGLDYVGEIRLTPESFNGRAASLSTNPPYSTFYVTGTPELVPIAFNNHNQLFVIFTTQTPGLSSNINVDYKGMTVDTNGYYNIFLQRFQFPKPTNQ